jgi:hypothetical protein
MAVTVHDEGEVHAGPADGKARPGNGLAVEHASDEEEDEGLTTAPGNGANPTQPQSP